MKPWQPMPRSKSRILVVDDELATRVALRDLLTLQGYDVDLAGDGAAALERLVELPPDLVITDLDMPHMSGLGLLGALREVIAERWVRDELGEATVQLNLLTAVKHRRQTGRRQHVKRAGHDGVMVTKVYLKLVVVLVADVLDDVFDCL